MKKPTLKPLTSVERDGRHYGIVEHKDGDHLCHTPFQTVKEGDNLVGCKNLAIVDRDGSFEMFTPGTKPCSGGPAQVATEAYRNGWEATFGARGGIS